MSLTPKILSFAVTMALAGAASAANTNSPAVGRALGLMQSHGSETRASANDKFVATDVMVDSDGTEHVRFDRTYAGLPVLGGDLVVHSRGGQFNSASLTLKTAGRPDLTPTISSDQAIERAGSQFGTGFIGLPTSRLVIYARGARPTLAHEVLFSGVKADQTPTDMHYIVDARSGRILDKWDTIQTSDAAGTGKTIFSGNITLSTNSLTTGGYEMRHVNRGGTYTTDFKNGATSKPGTGTIYTDADNIWGNNANTDRASAGADAHFGLGKTWDFYGTFNRNGIDNTGRGSYSRTHVGRNYVNAFWSDSCFCMSYGDGDGVTYDPLVTLDIAGHEVTHGVTSKTAKLVYSGESGGLNEATSDIMGTFVEFYANNALDVPDYLIGEEIYRANIAGSANQTALRYMFNPFKDGRSPNCYTNTIGSLDVHYSSGVANHFVYLLAEGTGDVFYNGVNHNSPTCNGTTIAGIGRDATQKIWYRALTIYMTSNTNYAGARAATISAASDLGYSTSAVAAAWSAVSVN